MGDRMSAWKEYVAEQAKIHPSMEPQDLYKLLFQAVFGAEHLLRDTEAAWRYFQEEYNEISPEEERLWEPIHDRICHVNLRAWKKKGLPPEWLFRMFADSMNSLADREGTAASGWEEIFCQYEEIAGEAVREGFFSFSEEAFYQYGDVYKKEGIHAVHHSAGYRQAEHPAYRLVDRRYLRLLPVLEELWNRNQMQGNSSVVIALDGRCASGKTTMARMLSVVTGAGIIHMDDFFLPGELRSESRLAEPGGNIHYERFAEEVLPYIRREEGFSYRVFDCGTMCLGEKREIPQICEAVPIRVVEGVYSRHPFFGSYADITIFSDVEPEEQLARIEKRSGKEMLKNFQSRWIPMEERYFETYHVKEQSDIYSLS